VNLGSKELRVRASSRTAQVNAIADNGLDCLQATMPGLTISKCISATREIRWNEKGPHPLLLENHC